MTPEYLDVPCKSGDTLRIRVRHLVHRERSAHQLIEVFDTWEFGKCLVLDGVIQASEKDHGFYDREMLGRLRPTDREILILGGGDGYIAEMALRMNPGIRVRIVDLDDSVAQASYRYLGQRVFDHPGVRLIVADALLHMASLTGDHYDGVVCDFTDSPVGYEERRFRDFYLAIAGGSARVLKGTGWMSVYAGVYPDRIHDPCMRFFSTVRQKDIFVPSFGEPCSIVFCEDRTLLSNPG